MSVTSERTGEEAVISVQKKFSLTHPGAKKSPVVRRAATVQPSPRAQTPSSLGQGHIAKGAMLPPPVDDKLQRELEKFKAWATDAIKGQQNDIDRFGGAIDRIERELKSFKDFMQEVRTELAAHSQSQASLKEEELPVLKEEFHMLRNELAAHRRFQESLKGEELPVLQEDLDALRTELAKTQQLQHELKHEDLARIRQSVNGLRQNVDSREANVKLAEKATRLAQDKLETFTDDVRKANSAANEVIILRGEFEDLRARLLSMENAAQEALVFREANSRANEVDVLKAEFEHLKKRFSSMEKAAQEALVSQAAKAPETRSATRRHPSDQGNVEILGSQGKDSGYGNSQPSISRHLVPQPSYEGEVEEPSLPKRRHSRLMDNDEESRERPIKRPRHSTRLKLAKDHPVNGTTEPSQIQPETPQSPIIISSNHGTPSPILSHHDVQYEDEASNYQNGDESSNQNDDMQSTPKQRPTKSENLERRKPVAHPRRASVSTTSSAGRLKETAESIRIELTSKDSAAKRLRRPAAKPGTPFFPNISSENKPLPSTPMVIIRSVIDHSVQDKPASDPIYKNSKPSGGVVSTPADKIEGGSFRQELKGSAPVSKDPKIHSSAQSYQAKRTASDKENKTPARARQYTPDELNTTDDALMSSTRKRASDGAIIMKRRMSSNGLIDSAGKIDNHSY
jgi:hypothetical protein